MLHETRRRFRLELPDGQSKAIDSLFMDPAAPSAIFHVIPTEQTDRMIAQQIGLTVSPSILADHGAILSEYFAEHPEQFLKTIIPWRSKPEILRRLRQVNITANTLFPGIDGLGALCRRIGARRLPPYRRYSRADLIIRGTRDSAQPWLLGSDRPGARRLEDRADDEALCGRHGSDAQGGGRGR